MSDKTPLRFPPETLRQLIHDSAKNQLAGRKIEAWKTGLIAASLEDALDFGGDKKANRKQVLKWLTGRDSLSEIPDSVQLALYDWLNPQKWDGQRWTADQVAVDEVVAVFNVVQPRQTGLFGGG